MAHFYTCSKFCGIFSSFIARFYKNVNFIVYFLSNFWQALEHSKSYFSQKHEHKLNLRVSGIEITFILLSDLNKKSLLETVCNCLQSILESGIILSYVYFICSYFMKVPHLVHGPGCTVYMVYMFPDLSPTSLAR